MTGYYIAGGWILAVVTLICWPRAYAHLVKQAPLQPDEPEPPVDPQALDQLPPEDVDACTYCGGTGAIWPSNDPQDVEPCPFCRGEGYIPEWSAA